jgi:hypothetical protein
MGQTDCGPIRRVAKRSVRLSPFARRKSALATPRTHLHCRPHTQPPGIRRQNICLHLKLRRIRQLEKRLSRSYHSVARLKHPEDHPIKRLWDRPIAARSVVSRKGLSDNCRSIIAIIEHEHAMHRFDERSPRSCTATKGLAICRAAPCSLVPGGIRVAQRGCTRPPTRT